MEDVNLLFVFIIFCMKYFLVVSVIFLEFLLLFLKNVDFLVGNKCGKVKVLYFVLRKGFKGFFFLLGVI